MLFQTLVKQRPSFCASPQIQRPQSSFGRRKPRFQLPVRAAERKGFGDEERIAAQQTQPKERPAPMQLGEPPRSPRERQLGQSFQEVPEVVNNRMLGRIVLCAGLPTFTGFALFPFFYWLRVAQGIKVPMPAVYGVQFVTFGAGLVGITYGILSASWDPKKEGSWLGLTEFKANVPNVLASLKKNR